jgi:hypothetical protein
MIGYVGFWSGVVELLVWSETGLDCLMSVCSATLQEYFSLPNFDNLSTGKLGGVALRL